MIFKCITKLLSYRSLSLFFLFCFSTLHADFSAHDQAPVQQVEQAQRLLMRFNAWQWKMIDYHANSQETDFALKDEEKRKKELIEKFEIIKKKYHLTATSDLFLKEDLHNLSGELFYAEHFAKTSHLLLGDFKVQIVFFHKIIVRLCNEIKVYEYLARKQLDDKGKNLLATYPLLIGPSFRDDTKDILKKISSLLMILEDFWIECRYNLPSEELAFVYINSIIDLIAHEYVLYGGYAILAYLSIAQILNLGLAGFESSFEIYKQALVGTYSFIARILGKKTDQKDSSIDSIEAYKRDIFDSNLMKAIAYASGPIMANAACAKLKQARIEKNKMRLNAHLDGRSHFEKISDSHLVASVTLYGAQSQQVALRNVIDYLRNAPKYNLQDIKAPRGVLLYGPSGTGKTLLAQWLRQEAGCHFEVINAQDFLTKQGFAHVLFLYERAVKNAPSIIFIDEIDRVVGGKRTEQGALNPLYSKIQSWLLTTLDGVNGANPWAPVIVVGATNRPNHLDEDVLRRFSLKIETKVPNIKVRHQMIEGIIKAFSQNRGTGLPEFSVDPAVDINHYAHITEGKNPDFIKCMVQGAARQALSEGRTIVTAQDFEIAYNSIALHVAVVKPGV